MKTTVRAAAIFAVLTMGAVAQAERAPKDPTKYDCRVVVGHKRETYGNKGFRDVAIWACPYKDMMAAGKCEVNWLGQMRCKQ